jgi:regulator of nucleoside diphosphate kinase
MSDTLYLDAKKSRTVDHRDISITKFDLKRLSELVRSIAVHGKDHTHLASLVKELDRAHVVDPSEIPSDVVTMNSKVRLKDLENSKERVCTLVFPSEANILQNKISILAPVGTALLGYRTGDTIEWPVPAGVRTLKIEEVLYQPEAEGNYDL